MAHFAVENLSFTYPKSDMRALDGVTLNIASGEYLCVCGSSGCGKTTLLRHFKSHMTPVGTRLGEVLFDGIPLDGIDGYVQSSQIGFVMQNPEAQIVTDKVWHELAFGLENLGIDQHVMRVRVAEMAGFFGISHWFHRDISELSGGQKQLLNLASVMVMHPSVLVLDEPTSQLDPIAASDFLGMVRKINIELGTTVIIAEHRLEDIFPVVDTVVIMDDGRISSAGTPREVSAMLYESDSAMTSALPTPVRIFYDVMHPSSPCGAYSGFDPDSIASCPLTIREGRLWLSEYVHAHEPSRREIHAPESVCASGSEPALKVRNIWFRYEKNAADVLRDASLDIARSTLHAIVGENGAGKSTLLKCMCGICNPYRGSVRILGNRGDTPAKKALLSGGVALLPQDPQTLFVTDSVYEDLAEMLDGRIADEGERGKRVEGVARLCRISHLLNAHPMNLSGGEQQRVALAKVLLCDASLLVFDEPTKAMDNSFKEELALLLDSLKRRGVTIVIATHDIEFCARYADCVSMFFDGGILASGSPREVFSQNNFYTTSANRMSRGVFENAITDQDVVDLCLS